MTHRPALTVDHYLDAVALTRASLHGDDAAVLTIAQHSNVGMMLQALVHLHLSVLFGVAGEDSTAAEVDAFLCRQLRDLPTVVPGPGEEQR